MNPQPQSIYQKVIDRTKSIGFQTQFLAQNVEKVLAANSLGYNSKQVRVIQNMLSLVTTFYCTDTDEYGLSNWTMAYI